MINFLLFRLFRNGRDNRDNAFRSASDRETLAQDALADLMTAFLNAKGKPADDRAWAEYRKAWSGFQSVVDDSDKTANSAT